MASYMEQIYQTYDWKVPRHITKKPSKLPAIDKPLPGTSYNPTYDDHQVKIQMKCITYRYFVFVLGVTSKSCGCRTGKRTKRIKLTKKTTSTFDTKCSGTNKSMLSTDHFHH